MTTTTGIPAGWYGDPQAPATAFRYWDGTAWTQHVTPRAPVVQPFTGYGQPAQRVQPAQTLQPVPTRSAPAARVGQNPNDPVHWLVPTGRPWQTIAAGWAGLLSLAVFFLGPVAIVLGILGLRAAREQRSHGRGRAIFGIVTGSVSTVLLLSIIIDALGT